jgi:hypothetical protein
MSAYKKVLRKDLRYGNKKEKQILPILEEHFGITLSKTKGYATFDYHNEEEKIYIELKSRRNRLKQYPTTMVGFNKFESGYELIKQGYTIYFVFKFTDGIAYYQLAENNFEVKQGGRQDRGKKEIKSYVYIPIIELINIFQNKNPTLDIQPTMTDQEVKTKDQRPLSYSKRLIIEFDGQDKDTFNMDEIKELIEDFSKKEYEKRKGKTDEMPFGKYKYKKVADVAKFDKQYLKWLVRQEMINKYEELKEEINKHL